MERVRQHQDAAATGRLAVPQETLAAIESLYHAGKFRQAYEQSQTVGPLWLWDGVEERIFAGRLIGNLGAPRLARTMHVRAFRQHPEHAEARYYFLFWAFARRGPWAALRWLEKFGDPVGERPTLVADWYALKATVYAAFRDFETADLWMRRAFEIAPDRPWLWVEQATIYEQQDRPQDALEAGRKALGIRPWYRPGVQHVAYRLVQLNRDDEALELLQGATRELESGDVLAQLAALQTELQQYDEARRNFDRIEHFHPLLSLDKSMTKWIAARKADAAYYCDDLAAAATFAEQSDNKFFTRLAERLRVELSGEGRRAKRALLPVKFVQQHHMTCAPATLAAIAAYWDRPAEHLEIADSICYEGTPGYNERRWAEQNGFDTREFRVTWDSAVALLDRGIPFTLTTVNPGSAHLQAVIGYDELRGTLIVRDPNERHSGEFACEEMLKHYASSGPRGMAMTPKQVSESASFSPLPAAGRGAGGEGPGIAKSVSVASPTYSGLDLPDAPFYDLQYELDLALEGHDRPAAVAALDKMKQLDANHRITLRCACSVASYDCDRRGYLEATEQLRKQFPDDVNLLMAQIGALTDLGRRSEMLAVLESACAKPDCDSMFWDRYARELADDARQHAEAERLLRRALKYRPTDGRLYWSLANLRWDHQRRDESLRLYRLSACLDEKQETPAKAYFRASRYLRQTDVAMRFLEDRYRRFGGRSAWPAQTLCWALDQLEQTQRAFELIGEALQKRPDDPDLLLYAADLHGRYGRLERTKELLEAARPKSHRLVWLRAAATLAGYRGAGSAALGYWRQVAEAEPQSRDGHEQVAVWLADLEGEPAVVAYLREQVERFPQNVGLRSLLIEWLRGEPVDAEAALRELLEQHPADAWAQRELAATLLGLNRLEDAARTIELARQLDPTHAYVDMLHGRCELGGGRLAEAKEAFRNCLRNSVDFESAIHALVDVCEAKSEREAELNFIADELRRQVTFGDGLLAWQSRAKETLPGESVLETLRAARASREDLWQTWTTLELQFIAMKRVPEAREVAQGAVERFPLLPRAWFDLSVVCREANDEPAEIAALEQALTISPAWGMAARQLAETYDRRGDLARARTLLESTVAQEPRDARNHGCLADLLWKLGDKEAAVARAEQSLRVDVNYDWAWHTLRSWWKEVERPERGLELCRELTAQRPRDAQAWLALADVIEEREQFDEAFAAIDRALEIRPRNTRAYQMRSWFLAQLERYDEALAACRPEIFPEPRPLDLRSREAFVLYSMGRRDDAIACMRAVVETDADYYFGWKQLAEWLDQGPDVPAYLEAARNMARLAPESPVAWGYLGDAESRSENRSAAREAFERAFELAPEYSFGAVSLFDMQLAANELDAAAATLERASPHLQSDHAALYGLQLAARRDDRETALARFADLCATPEADAYSVGKATDQLIEKRWTQVGRDIAQQRLEAVVADHAVVVAPPVVKAWAKLAFSVGSFFPFMAEAFLKKLRDTPLEGRAAMEFIREASRRGHDMNAVQRIVRRYRAALRADNECWYGVGSVYVDHYEFGRGVKWCADWRERELSALQLMTVVITYWSAARPEQALEVVQRALSLKPDTSTSNHRFWFGVYQLLYGSVPVAIEELRAIPNESLWEYYVDMRRLVDVVLDAATNLESNYASRVKQLNVAWEEISKSNRDLLMKRMYWLLRRRLAQHYRRPLSSVWCAFRAAWSRVRWG